MRISLTRCAPYIEYTCRLLGMHIPISCVVTILCLPVSLIVFTFNLWQHYCIHFAANSSTYLYVPTLSRNVCWVCVQCMLCHFTFSIYLCEPAQYCECVFRYYRILLLFSSNLNGLDVTQGPGRRKRRIVCGVRPMHLLQIRFSLLLPACSHLDLRLSVGVYHFSLRHQMHIPTECAGGRKGERKTMSSQEMIS